MKLFLTFIFVFSTMARGADCGAEHLSAKETSELSKIISPKFDRKILDKKNKQYLIDALARNKLNKRYLKATEVLFSNLNFNRAKYIFETWIIGEKPKTGQWNYLRYIFFRKLDHLSDADLFVRLVNKINSDRRAWDGFNQLIGERNVKTKIDKTIHFLITLNQEINSHSAGALSLNKYLDKIYELKKSIEDIEDSLLDFLDSSFWKYVTLRSVDARYDRLRKYQKVRDYFVGTFGSFVERLKEMLFFIPRKLRGKGGKSKEFKFISTHLMVEIIASSQTDDIISGLQKVNKKYSADFLNLVFSNVSHKKILKYVKSLEELYPIYLNKRAIFDRIDWSQKSIRELFISRNNESDDAVEAVMRLVENIADHARFSDDMQSKGTPKQVEKHINDIFRVLSKNTDEGTYGVNQLFKELGAKSDEVNHKFRGAHFTYMFFEEFLKSKKYDQILGFEIPMRIVKDLGDKKKSYFLFGSMYRGEQILKMVDFQTGKSMTKRIEFNSIPDKSTQCFSIINAMLELVPCSKKKGVFQVIHSRKGDFAYKKGGRYYFLEMKNFGTSLSPLYAKDKNGEVGISREWAFDSFVHFINKSKYRFKWVINKSSLQGRDFKDKSDGLDNYFLNVLPYEQRFQELQKNIQAINPDLEKLSEHFTSQFGIEFFPPRIETESYTQ